MENAFRRLEQVLVTLDHRIILAGSMLVVVLCGYLDYHTGFELSFFLFYLLPISVTVWFVGSKSALAVSLASAVVWAISNRLAGEIYSHGAIEIWNTLLRLGVFVIVSLLLSYLKQSLERERKLSRTDFLTGITNSRSFHELASSELNRARRYKHPISVAYIDLDNFKQVNDGFGHSAGDALLKMVAETVLSNLRQTDIVARLGGDEFAVLLPVTGREAAEQAVRKLREELLKRVREKSWGVTFSIGVMTFSEYPASSDEMLHRVDKLMYEVKAGGKDNIRYGSAG